MSRTDATRSLEKFVVGWTERAVCQSCTTLVDPVSGTIILVPECAVHRSICDGRVRETLQRIVAVLLVHSSSVHLADDARHRACLVVSVHQREKLTASIVGDVERSCELVIAENSFDTASICHVADLVVAIVAQLHESKGADWRLRYILYPAQAIVSVCY